MVAVGSSHDDLMQRARRLVEPALMDEYIDELKWRFDDLVTQTKPTSVQGKQKLLEAYIRFQTGLDSLKPIADKLDKSDDGVRVKGRRWDRELLINEVEQSLHQFLGACQQFQGSGV